MGSQFQHKHISLARRRQQEQKLGAYPPTQTIILSCRHSLTQPPTIRPLVFYETTLLLGKRILCSLPLTSMAQRERNVFRITVVVRCRRVEEEEALECSSQFLFSHLIPGHYSPSANISASRITQTHYTDQTDRQTAGEGRIRRI